jgi:hypothetical protein
VLVINGAGLNTIGDDLVPANRNVISGNAGSGVNITGSTIQDVRVFGNIIGFDANITQARPNGQAGITIIDAKNITIGNVENPTGGYLLVSGNLGQGIYARGAQNLTVDSGVTIGSDGRAQNMGNHLEGILLEDTQYTWINPTFVTKNGGAGIAVIGAGAQNNNLQPGNDMYNGGLAIDLGNDGFTPNDPGDLDSGPNGLLNYPVITAINGNSVVGTACANCSVILYRTYAFYPNPIQPGGGFNAIADNTQFAVADAAGNWAATLPAGWSPHWVTLQAFQSQANPGYPNTSELSPLAPWVISLPLIHR